jgi:translation initiation factor 4E
MADISSIQTTSSTLSKIDLSASDENNNSAKPQSLATTITPPTSSDTAHITKNSLTESTQAAAPPTSDNTMTASELPDGQIPAASSETNENNNNNTTIETNSDNLVNGTTTEQTTTEPDLHELQTEWSLWLYTNNKSRKWEENLQHVISFKSVEEFWAVYNHIQLSSKLTPGHDYALFRAGTRPAWEDEANKTGGRWMLQLPAKQHRATNLDRLWLELMLLIIGEDFNNPEEASLINGAVVSIRFKEDRIALWTGDASQGQSQRAIGQQLKNRLNLQATISFERHADQSGPKSKHKPPMYTV